MFKRLLHVNAVSLLLLVLVTAATRAADVDQHVPNDAIGFVIIKNVGAVDAKIEQLLNTLHVELPSPLAFLKAATGVGDGLEPQGDFLLAVLPGQEAEQDKPQYCVLLPIDSFERFVASLNATPGQGINTVTVAGENLLVAQHGQWALLMDPGQRARMERLLAEEPNPPAAVDAWRDWIEAGDIAAVLLSDGIRPMMTGASPAGEAAADTVDASQLSPVSNWLSQSPKLSEWVLNAKAIGFTFRLDEANNALASLRVSRPEETFKPAVADDNKSSLPALYEGGNFVLYGAGSLPPALTIAAAGVFVEALAADLKNQQRLVLDNATVARFQQALEQAAAEVSAAVVLTQPGDKSAGIYTNDFLIVRAASASAFVDHASEVMRLWNTMNRDAEGEARLVFDVEEQKLGGRAATQYSLDIGAAEGAAELPEIRQAMEKFFGPGGKLRLWIVPVDDQTVLLAAATRDEVAAALQVVDRKQPIDWNRPELAAANALLPEQADWRLFFSPHAYHRWQMRLMDAMTGPVFGGRPAEEFPASPPVGAAGRFRDNELQLDAAIPAKTIQRAGAFRKK